MKEREKEPNFSEIRREYQAGIRSSFPNPDSKYTWQNRYICTTSTQRKSMKLYINTEIYIKKTNFV